ncbi:MAG: hypothetical protein COV74_01615 [Candidatus Omnitrophica bacterium CG11_big_fil_rev_8_21_14_0_20_45_26]|uniref:Pilus assembly protein PilO n=1 Tax=Candidatus Abzuiibacterium crystallinum TaxID=1974748 RepID=A0A2H0LUS7_9BACT|nr:MAG: hypothetical protein COV74_01615 [Candidatus Omnitrophica bacterium CG11_big_fil_rev_8_21_14_0_20_45_26]PIW64994.1 MAG: hypothetical protein COW12_03895 [Candidatus Omnitrophica bacterium CG12_big_fil_rev_8_21_14_0_65_45_16]
MATPQGKGQKKATAKKTPIEALKLLWEKDRKQVIQLGIIVLGVLVLLSCIVIPLFFKNSTIHNQVKQLELNIRTSKSKRDRIPELEEKLKQYETEIGSTRKRFFQIHELDELLGEISKLASKDGVTLVGSRPLSDLQKNFPAPYDKKYFAVTYELTLAGGYHQFGSLFSRLEQLDKLLLIRDLNIKQNSARSLQNLQCVVQVDAFVLAPQGL